MEDPVFDVHPVINPTPIKHYVSLALLAHTPEMEPTARRVWKEVSASPLALSIVQNALQDILPIPRKLVVFLVRTDTAQVREVNVYLVYQEPLQPVVDYANHVQQDLETHPPLSVTAHPVQQVHIRLKEESVLNAQWDRNQLPAVLVAIVQWVTPLLLVVLVNHVKQDIPHMRVVFVQNVHQDITPTKVLLARSAQVATVAKKEPHHVIHVDLAKPRDRVVNVLISAKMVLFTSKH